MSKTNELRKAIKLMIADAQISNLKGIYYEVADEDALFPHIVFDLESVNLGDLSRQDYRLTIDVWDRNQSAVNIEQIADKIEDTFNNQNAPQTTIYPTFYIESKRTIIDEDKKIRHKQIIISVQNYER